MMEDCAVERLIGLGRARQLVQRIDPLGVERISADNAAGRIAACDIDACCSCPTLDASLKDGFAVRGRDIASACRERPVPLTLVGSVVAGGHCDITVKTGQAVRIMTGAPIPAGADAVLASEFADTSGNQVLALADAGPGRNILACGSDVTAGSTIIDRGTRMFPGHLGLLAAAGVAEIPVFRQPRVLVIATGSELAVPGEPIAPGQVAASNLVTLMAEAGAMGIHADHLLVRDDLHLLQEKIAPLIEKYDVILTCGGVLDGDKDFTMQAMDNLGVEPVFRRVRVGPGKGVCLGKKDSTCIFNLPG
ncbi:MAG TPA: molybdopterin molybdenumtransferase MoeA, partial [Desulfobulbus sp.]|nr:molybdopterin molybdenumtransferase MoeA [Desulfobulbus sp.]